jgi:hypothetical protein
VGKSHEASTEVGVIPAESFVNASAADATPAISTIVSIELASVGIATKFNIILWFMGDTPEQN